MARWSLKSALATAFLVAGRLASAEEEPCNKCDPADQRVTVIVIEMGPKPDEVVPTTTVALPAAETIVTNAAEEKPPVQPPVHPENTTHIFTPCPAPGLDLTDPTNLVPVKNAALYYEAVEQEKPGSINMTLAFNNPAVILEHVEAIQNVTCSKDKLAVSFSTREAYDEAVQDWEIDEPFVLITRAQDNCSGDFERGFYLVADIVADVKNLVITTTAEKKELSDIAGECEMFFTSLPAATLTKRLTLDPKVSVGFSESLPDNTVLFTDGQYISIVAEEAYFSSNLTFSGYLKYNFWGFKLEQLYFDLDTNFKTAATLNAQVQAAFQKTLNYAPDALAWNVVDVPGIVQLGPGIAFGIRMDVNASAAVGIRTGLEIGIPHGNVHIDLLKGAKTETSGWEPKYESFANITQRADLGLDVMADVTVQLAFKLLGGLVDLSSGITASPGFANQFKLRGKQDLSAGGVGNQTHTGIGLPLDDVACASTNGVQFISKFLFSVKGFATKWFSKELYAVTVPIVDKCYSWGKA